MLACLWLTTTELALLHSLLRPQTNKLRRKSSLPTCLLALWVTHGSPMGFHGFRLLLRDMSTLHSDARNLTENVSESTRPKVPRAWTGRGADGGYIGEGWWAWWAMTVRQTPLLVAHASGEHEVLRFLAVSAFELLKDSPRSCGDILPFLDSKGYDML